MTVFNNDLSELRIGFIGAGRLGTALAWSLAARGMRVTSAASRTRSDAAALAAALAGCAVAASGQDVVDGCDLIFITTPDAAIAAVTQDLRFRPGIATVHCSGATEVSALEHAARDGAMIGGFHPMQTFADPLSAVRALPGSTITIEAPEPLNAVLVAIAERLECRINRLPPGMRGRYHAAAGYTSQFINAQFAEAVAIWQSWGASEEDAVRALLPLARGTLASIGALGIAEGMPGPVSRGDVASIEKHVTALTPLGPDTLEFYHVMCERTIRLGLARGAINQDAARRLRHILKG